MYCKLYNISKNETLFISVIIVMLAMSSYTNIVSADYVEREILLYTSRMLLQGKKLYQDLFTVQQPLIALLYMLPVYLARFLPLPDFEILALLGIGFIGLCVILSDRILKFHPVFVNDIPTRVRHAVLLCLIFMVFYGPVSFFDREHIFLILVFPYILRWGPFVRTAALPLKLRIAIGAMAAVGLCVKPQCFIIFIAVQCLYYLHEKQTRIFYSIENFLIYGFTLAYIAYVVIFIPEYLHIVLPMTLETYSACRNHYSSLFYTAIGGTILGVALVDFRWRMTSPYRENILYFLEMDFAFWLYGMANNGWGYTYRPFLCLTLLITGWIWAESLWLKRKAEKDGLQTQSYLFGSRACAISLICIFLFYAIVDFTAVVVGCTGERFITCTRQGNELISEMHNAQSFGSISGDFDIWARLSDVTHASWDTRFNHLWMLPKFLISDDSFKRQHIWILEYVADSLAADMEKNKPQIMFVDNTDTFYLTPVRVDLIAYFSMFPAFKEAWKHYYFDRSITYCSHPQKEHCSYDAYKRIN